MPQAEEISRRNSSIRRRPSSFPVSPNLPRTSRCSLYIPLVQANLLKSSSIFLAQWRSHSPEARRRSRSNLDPPPPQYIPVDAVVPTASAATRRPRRRPLRAWEPQGAGPAIHRTPAPPSPSFSGKTAASYLSPSPSRPMEYLRLKLDQAANRYNNYVN